MESFLNLFGGLAFGLEPFQYPNLVRFCAIGSAELKIN